ncbi:ABC transporter ATP-binding protein [Thiocapsa rosea]|uniref:ABC-2 type transport system ATP-binding protein n=1 Tax=Thiocapsa rosea TaxID=69360 RepID=A0A495VCZ5_9GAMM|nr:ABC transporter ATP-binding protein [Thiocapsa rosea]RKT47144.1 ABC-2 type transport system ATP-binding protein [Thiocapsa rosea]
MSQVATPEGMALELDSVSFAYPRRPVLQEVSFTVAAGAFCVLLGPNGAGKTTLFSLITRLFLCRSGSIRIFGHDLGREGREALGRLGVVFQQPTLDLDLSVDQNLRYYGALQGHPDRIMGTRIREALCDADLAERAGEKVRHLSGGQRRRLELARALLNDPRLLLADEPTVGLDIQSRRDIIVRVREGCGSRGVGVLWATHLVDEVEPHDQLVVLHQGRVVRQGIASAILAETGSKTVHQAYSLLTGGGPKS